MIHTKKKSSFRTSFTTMPEIHTPIEMNIHQLVNLVKHTQFAEICSTIKKKNSTILLLTLSLVCRDMFHATKLWIERLLYVRTSNFLCLDRELIISPRRCYTRFKHDCSSQWNSPWEQEIFHKIGLNSATCIEIKE